MPRRSSHVGLSPEALAFQAGLHRTYVSILERGLRNPTLGVLSQLAEALGTSMTAIVREIERRV